MLRALVLLLLGILLASGAAWLAGHDGRIVIDWLDYRIESSLAVLIGAAALLFLAGMGLARLWTWLWHDLPFSPRRRAERRTARGYDALNAALVALAAGEGKAARRMTNRAMRLLPAQPLTHVVAAEAAKLAGDRGIARAHYEALAKDEKAGFLGLRGLIAEARAEGRPDEARRQARAAVALRPRSAWAQKTLFELAVEAGDWQEALQALDAAQRAGAFDPNTARRHRAALLHARAVEADLAGDAGAALSLAEKALELRPGFTPAALLAARHLLKAGKKRAAGQLLRRAWDAAPHPALLGPYRDLAPEETSHERCKRIESLVARRKDHVESQVALAAAALDADRLDLARTVLHAAPLDGDRRLAALRLRLAEAEGDATAVADLKRRVEAAPPPPSWVCDGCGASRPRWAVTCPQCGRFDSLVWRQPGVAAAALGPAAAPLALLGDSAATAADRQA